MIVVSDTSPITNLSAVGALELLHQLYDRVIIPQAVYIDMKRQRLANHKLKSK